MPTDPVPTDVRMLAASANDVPQGGTAAACLTEGSYLIC
jgi:hypothetical protein